jgi:hypothetical protein
MKKVFILLSFISLILPVYLFPCCGYEGTFPYSKSKSDIDRIEIVQAKSSRSYALLYTIPKEDQTAFLDEFEELVFYEYLYGAPLGIGGDSVRIVYNDNSYDITNGVWSEYCFYVDGNLRAKSTCLHTHKGIREDVFSDFIEKWLRVQKE